MNILSNIAELLAKLAKDIQAANSQAQAMPDYATQTNDLSAIGVWTPSSGISANCVQSSQVNLDTCVSSSYQTAKAQNLPEFVLLLLGKNLARRVYRYFVIGFIIKSDKKRTRIDEDLYPSHLTTAYRLFVFFSGILREKFPEKSAGLFQHLDIVLEAFRNFGGSAWYNYDEAFHQIGTSYLKMGSKGCWPLAQPFSTPKISLCQAEPEFSAFKQFCM